MSEIKVPTVSTSPAEDALLAGNYQPRSKSSFLTGMFRTLSAGSRALMYYGPGSLPHRILEAGAIELSRLSFDVQRLMVRGIREAAYRAFEDPLFFPARKSATFSTGLVRVAVPLNPFDRDVAIPAGDLMSAPDGLTVRVLEGAVLRAGETSVLVTVVSEVPGPSGAVASGRINAYLNNSTLRVSNPAPITGGRDEETDDAIHARFGRYLLGLKTGNEASLLSAAENTLVNNIDVKQAALIRPWRIPWLNREMGYGYVAIDCGPGSAPPSVVLAAQARVDAKAAALQEAVVISCSPYAVSLAVQVAYQQNVDNGVQSRLRAAYARAFDETRIEDGSGRGAVPVADLVARLGAVPGVLSVIFLDLDGTLPVPVAARAVAGNLTINGVA